MFLITNTECKQYKIINLDMVREIMISPSHGIQVYYENGNGTQIGQYENRSQCVIAMRMFQKALDMKKDIFEFPSEEKIKAEVVNTYQEKTRPMGGKKSKGHGGS